MTKDEMLLLPLGAPVVYSAKLRRSWRGEELEEVYWKSIPCAGALTGVYIGYRWLPEGRLGVVKDDSIFGETSGRWEWHTAGPGKGILAALVVYHPRKKPIYVDPEYLTCH